MADTIPVSFAGEGCGIAELSWGQQVMWRGLELTDFAPNILTGVTPLPDGTTVRDEAGMLSYLMGRHQSLRTKVQRGEDGQPRQVVASSGEVDLEIVDAPDDADPLTFARALEVEFEQTAHDCLRDWPVRMAVVMHRGAPAMRVLGLCHLTTDGFGVMILLKALGGEDPVTGDLIGPVLDTDPVTAMEPLEQARWQCSPAGLRRSARTEQYWERLLRTIPARRFPDSRDPRDPRGGHAIIDSPATYLAIQPIAERLNTDTSPVLLAAAAVAMAKVSGINPVVPRAFVSNRFRPRLADTVSPIAQTCPCVIDVAGITFDQAVRRAMSGTIVAFKYAYFKPARIRELLAAVSEERGEAIDLNFVYNDRRLAAPREATAALPEPADVRAALDRTTLHWENQSDQVTDFFHVHVRDVAESVSVLVVSDTHYIAPADVEAFLYELEAVAVRAAFDPDAPTGV